MFDIHCIDHWIYLHDHTNSCVIRAIADYFIRKMED